MGMSQSVTGVEGGDGWITLIAAAIVAVAVLAGSWGKLGRGVTVFFGLIIAAIGLMYIGDPATGVEGSEIAQAVLDPAIGLYVTALGGVLAVAGGLIGGDEQPAGQQQVAQQPHQPGGTQQEAPQHGRQERQPPQDRQQRRPQDDQQPQSGEGQTQPRQSDRTDE